MTPEETREAVATALRGEHPVWLGDAYGTHEVEVSAELADHLADALAPVLARIVAEARGEGAAQGPERVVAVRHESGCSWVTNQSWCDCGLDDAWEAGRAEGAAEVRAQVFEFLDATPVCREHAAALVPKTCRECYAAREIGVYDDSIRAALTDTDEAAT